MDSECRPFLGPPQSLLGLLSSLQFEEMTTRNNKTSRGRISKPTRAIFYDNLRRGLEINCPGPVKAKQIRWLMRWAHLSRSQAQRYVEIIQPGAELDDEQAPTLDTLAFVAAAFGAAPPQFLTQGCKLYEQQNHEPPPDVPASQKPVRDSDLLQRPSSRKATRRRS